MLQMQPATSSGIITITASAGPAANSMNGVSSAHPVKKNSDQLEALFMCTSACHCAIGSGYPRVACRGACLPLRRVHRAGTMAGSRAAEPAGM